MQYSIIPHIKFVLQLVLSAFLLLSTGCAPTATATSLKPLRVQYSFAVRPWLTNLSNCAGNNGIVIEQRAEIYQEIKSTDLVIHFGQPIGLASPAYQIGTDDLLVIVNRQNKVDKLLTSDQVKALFTGRIQSWKSINGEEAPVQVWVFSPGEDIQMIFDQDFLVDSAIASTARLASSPEEMLQAVSNDVYAIGLITRKLKTEDTSEVFTIARALPVLALTSSEPQGKLAQVLACLQK